MVEKTDDDAILIHLDNDTKAQPEVSPNLELSIVAHEIVNTDNDQDGSPRSLDYVGLIYQCQQFHKDGKHKQIISLLENFDGTATSPELSLHLARAYNMTARSDETLLFQKAIDLLLAQEEYFHNNFEWNFQLGYAYYYLEQETLALTCFDRARTLRPQDEDTQFFYKCCIEGLTLQRFVTNYHERCRGFWYKFQLKEKIWRSWLKDENTQDVVMQISSLLKETLGKAEIQFDELSPHFCEISFILTGYTSMIYPIVHLCSIMPKALSKHWKFHVGDRKRRDLSIVFQDTTIAPEQIFVKLIDQKQLPQIDADYLSTVQRHSDLSTDIRNDLINFAVFPIPQSGFTEQNRSNTKTAENSKSNSQGNTAVTNAVNTAVTNAVNATVTNYVNTAVNSAVNNAATNTINNAVNNTINAVTNAFNNAGVDQSNDPLTGKSRGEAFDGSKVKANGISSTSSDIEAHAGFNIGSDDGSKTSKTNEGAQGVAHVASSGVSAGDSTFTGASHKTSDGASHGHSNGNFNVGSNRESHGKSSVASTEYSNGKSTIAFAGNSNGKATSTGASNVASNGESDKDSNIGSNGETNGDSTFTREANGEVNGETQVESKPFESKPFIRTEANFEIKTKARVVSEAEAKGEIEYTGEDTDEYDHKSHGKTRSHHALEHKAGSRAKGDLEHNHASSIKGGALAHAAHAKHAVNKATDAKDNNRPKILYTVNVYNQQLDELVQKHREHPSKELADQIEYLSTTMIGRVRESIGECTVILAFDVIRVLSVASYFDYLPCEAITLDDLNDKMQELGFAVNITFNQYISKYNKIKYDFLPSLDPMELWRKDIFQGYTRVSALLSELLRNKYDVVNHFHKIGLAAGFLSYEISSYGCPQLNISRKRAQNQKLLIEALEQLPYIKIIGAANGAYRDYVDILYPRDIGDVLTKAYHFFNEHDITTKAYFGPFRKDVPCVTIYDRNTPENSLFLPTSDYYGGNGISLQMNNDSAEYLTRFITRSIASTLINEGDDEPASSNVSSNERSNVRSDLDSSNDSSSNDSDLGYDLEADSSSNLGANLDSTLNSNRSSKHNSKQNGDSLDSKTGVKEGLATSANTGVLANANTSATSAKSSNLAKSATLATTATRSTRAASLAVSTTASTTASDVSEASDISETSKTSKSSDFANISDLTELLDNSRSERSKNLGAKVYAGDDSSTGADIGFATGIATNAGTNSVTHASHASNITNGADNSNLDGGLGVSKLSDAHTQSKTKAGFRAQAKAGWGTDIDASAKDTSISEASAKDDYGSDASTHDVVKQEAKRGALHSSQQSTKPESKSSLRRRDTSSPSSSYKAEAEEILEALYAASLSPNKFSQVASNAYGSTEGMTDELALEKTLLLKESQDDPAADTKKRTKSHSKFDENKDAIIAYDLSSYFPGVVASIPPLPSKDKNATSTKHKAGHKGHGKADSHLLSHNSLAASFAKDTHTQDGLNHKYHSKHVFNGDISDDDQVVQAIADVKAALQTALNALQQESTPKKHANGAASSKASLALDITPEVAANLANLAHLADTSESTDSSTLSGVVSDNSVGTANTVGNTEGNIAGNATGKSDGNIAGRTTGNTTGNTDTESLVNTSDAANSLQSVDAVSSGKLGTSVDVTDATDTVNTVDTVKGVDAVDGIEDGVENIEGVKTAIHSQKADGSHFEEAQIEQIKFIGLPEQELDASANEPLNKGERATKRAAKQGGTPSCKHSGKQANRKAKKQAASLLNKSKQVNKPVSKQVSSTANKEVSELVNNQADKPVNKQACKTAKQSLHKQVVEQKDVSTNSNKSTNSTNKRCRKPKTTGTKLKRTDHKDS